MSKTCPKANEDCPWYGRPAGCHVSVHHEYWPKSKYRSAIEKKFRENILNKVVICRADHDDIHNTQPIPDKPTRSDMLRFIDGKG